MASEGNNKKKKNGGGGKYSHRLSGMKFMKRARERQQAQKEEKELKSSKSSSSQNSQKKDSSTTTTLAAGKGGNKGCSIIFEADPLPRGRTTGRLSFGKKPKVAAEDVASKPIEPKWEEEKQSSDVGVKKRQFVKPNPRDIKKFKTSQEE
mmetsp:Transcript_14754/g.28557  ORF Transcript_14754/g.28557 Transcript_14754/m.28557 type:complete len:150 (+) Transcript_14754:198-647(+)